FREPLRDNPAGKMFRALTKKAHTEDELPLSRQQIQWADRVFGGGDHIHLGFASTAIGFITSFTPLSANNLFLRVADSIDRAIARTPLKWWMRRVVLIWRKR